MSKLSKGVLNILNLLEAKDKKVDPIKSGNILKSKASKSTSRFTEILASKSDTSKLSDVKSSVLNLNQKKVSSDKGEKNSLDSVLRAFKKNGGNLFKIQVEQPYKNSQYKEGRYKEVQSKNEHPGEIKNDLKIKEKLKLVLNDEFYQANKERIESKGSDRTKYLPLSKATEEEIVSRVRMIDMNESIKNKVIKTIRNSFKKKEEVTVKELIEAARKIKGPEDIVKRVVNGSGEDLIQMEPKINNQLRITNVGRESIQAWFDRLETEIVKMSEFRIDSPNRVQMLLREDENYLRIIVNKNREGVLLSAITNNESLKEKVELILNEMRLELRERNISLRLDVKNEEEQQQNDNRDNRDKKREENKGESKNYFDGEPLNSEEVKKWTALQT